MGECTKENNYRSLCDSTEPTRGLLILMCIMIIVACLVIIAKQYEPALAVHACSDKDRNPIEVQILCMRLTKYQWWGAYYGGKK